MNFNSVNNSTFNNNQPLTSISDTPEDDQIEEFEDLIAASALDPQSKKALEKELEDIQELMKEIVQAGQELIAAMGSLQSAKDPASASAALQSINRAMGKINQDRGQIKELFSQMANTITGATGLSQSDKNTLFAMIKEGSENGEKSTESLQDQLNLFHDRLKLALKSLQEKALENSPSNIPIIH